MQHVLPQRAWARMGIRLKVAAALFGCALFSLGSGTIVTIHFSERALRAEVADKARRVMDNEIQDVGRLLDRAMYDLTTIAETNVMQDVLIADDMGEIAQSLATIRPRYREFSTLFVIDDTGEAIASEGLASAPENLLNLEQVQQSLAGQLVAGRFDEHPAVADDSFLFSAPIRASYDPDTVIGAIFGTIDMDRMRERLSRVQIGENAQSGERILLLRSDGGQILYQSASPDANEVIKSLLQVGDWPSDASALISTEDHGNYLLSSAVLPADRSLSDLGLRLVSGISEEAAFSSIAQLKHNLVLTTVLMGVGMLLLGWFGARSLTSPISAVSEAMNRLSREAGHDESRIIQDTTAGNLISPSILARQDEIGILGRSFDVLILQLAQARARLIEQSEAEITKRNQRLDAALNNMSQGLCMYGPDEKLIISNTQFEAIYGLPQGAIGAGMQIQEVLEVLKDAGHYSEERIAELREMLASLVHSQRTLAYLENIRDDLVVSVSCVPMTSGGWVATFEDVTQRQKAEARIEHMAHHDGLTDLPNRTMFRKKLEEAMQSLSRGKQLAVLYLDLDHFKSVNDTLGHPVGDQLLREVAERLRGSVRSTDVVARLGGDEFAILETEFASSADARQLAERVIAELSQPFEVSGHQIVIGTSVGISLFPGDAASPDDLVKAADMALYRSKADGRGTFCFFEKEMDASMQRRRLLELDLRKALANEEFEVHYQPIVDLTTERINCFEALLRWKHPERGSVSPADFIPLAEEIGLINNIGVWVLEQACHAAVQWTDNVRVAVNLSPAQFRSHVLVGEVVQALKSSGLAPERLELEITESILLQQTDLALSILKELRGLGVRVSMDDFGTGYSSLGYLRTFPFDKIKIDQSFIRDVAKNGDALSIVRAISGLGTNLGMTTTAEGVETLEQLQQLRIEGCTEVQGYFFSPAVPSTEAMRLVGAKAFQRGSREATDIALSLAVSTPAVSRSVARSLPAE